MTGKAELKISDKKKETTYHLYNFLQKSFGKTGKNKIEEMLHFMQYLAKKHIFDNTY